VNAPRGVVLMTVTGKKDPYVPKLDEVKEKVRQDVIRVKAAEMSRQRASEIAASLKSAKDFAAAAKAQGLEAKPTELVARGAVLPDIGASPEVDKVVFSLPKGAVSDPIRTSDGTVIVHVADRDEVTPEKLKAAKESFRAELLNDRRNRFFSAYMSKAKEKAKIDVKNDVLRRITAARA
jgi:parvulin-like peptidyl-prolyl isomerase